MTTHRLCLRCKSECPPRRHYCSPECHQRAKRVWLDHTGFFACKLQKDGPLIPVRVTWGWPTDPDTLETLDRSPRFNVVCGTTLVWAGFEPSDPNRMTLAGMQIEEEEYIQLLAEFHLNPVDIPTMYASEWEP